MRRAVLLVATPLLLAASCEDIGAPNISGVPGYLISSIRITPAIDTIFIPDTITVLDQVAFTATAISKNGATIPNMAFVWTVSNDALASIDADGVLTPKSTGTVFVTATADKTAHATLVILPEPPDLSKPAGPTGP